MNYICMFQETHTLMKEMNWKYGSSYTVSSSDGESNTKNNFTMKFNITNLVTLNPRKKINSNIDNIKKYKYKNHYNITKSQITYTQSYLDSQINTDIMKFFYSDEDIQGFYNKYTVQN